MLRISAVCAIIFIVLAIVGERIVALYDGDQETAERHSKAVFVFLLGTAYACALPSLAGGFMRAIQRVIAIGGAESRYADLIKSERFAFYVQRAVQAFAILAFVTTLIFSYEFLQGRA